MAKTLSNRARWGLGGLAVLQCAVHVQAPCVVGVALAAAFVAGVTRVFTVGGAQAVAALAYGTETVPQVDKITGELKMF